MKEFKVGGKIILEDMEAYLILDKIMYNQREYLFCCTESKPIVPKILKYYRENDNVFVKVEENPKMLFKLSNILVKRNNSIK